MYVGVQQLRRILNLPGMMGVICIYKNKIAIAHTLLEHVCLHSFLFFGIYSYVVVLQERSGDYVHDLYTETYIKRSVKFTYSCSNGKHLSYNSSARVHNITTMYAQF
jgi:hypothetical protein